jgi:ABC-type glutathione transport system ATPase component
MARPAVATATAVSSMDVVKEYGAEPSAVHAVRKVNLEVEFGEFVGVLGGRGRRC